MSWFKLESSLWGHPKVQRLGMILGIEETHALGIIVSLYCRTNMSKPDGNLSSWDDLDFAIACRWKGSPSELLSGLQSVKIVVDNGEGHEVNDWMEYAEGYKRATRERDRRQEKQKLADDVPMRAPRVTDSAPRAPGEERQTETKDRDKGQRTISPTPAEPTTGTGPLISQVWAHYRTHRKRAARVLKSTRVEYKRIKDRLDDGYTVAELCRCIDGYHQSAWHTGDNPGNKLFLGAELFFRTATHVQKGLEFADGERGLSTSERAKARFLAEDDNDGGTHTWGDDQGPVLGDIQTLDRVLDADGNDGGGRHERHGEVVERNHPPKPFALGPATGVHPCGDGQVLPERGRDGLNVQNGGERRDSRHGRTGGPSVDFGPLATIAPDDIPF